MQKLRWQLIIIFLTGLVVGFLLLGEQPSAQIFAPEPATGGVYAEALTGEIRRLNPVLDFYNPVDRDIDRLIYSGLIRFDDRGMPLADLAESWGISKDGTIYNFALRPGIKWHDGEPLTTRDVLFTVELIREGGEAVPEDLQNFWQQIEVIVLNDTSMQFRLPESFAPFLDYLSFGILPEHLLGSMTFEEMVNAPFNLQPVGSGPFRFERLIVEDNRITGVVLTAFDEYYGKKPYIEQVVFRLYPTSALSFQAYQDGVVKGIGNVTEDILPGVLAEPSLSLYTSRRPEMSIVFLNLKNPATPFFQDVAVRKALLQGLNRQRMIDQLLNGQAFVADGVVLPGSWAYYDGIERVVYDPEAARTQLKNAGYVVAGENPIRQKEGVALRFELIYPDDDFHAAQAEAMQKDWALLDIQVDLLPLPFDALINQRLAERNYQAALVDINLSRLPDPDPYPFWDQTQAVGGQNYSQWDNRTASEYLEQARITVDINERARMYRNFQVLFNEDLPSLPLYYPLYNYAVSEQIQGVRVGPLYDSSDRFSTLTDWYLITKLPSKLPANVP
ncbi:MAG: peptide ABC transporter substrate-binding protein [Anaerolineae bacterium]|nr:peptide ABC transporter substrate-binding protein [Anaerolineae bacterium]